MVSDLFYSDIKGECDIERGNLITLLVGNIQFALAENNLGGIGKLPIYAHRAHSPQMHGLVL